LRQIVEGKLPDEELYDLEADPWMVTNLIGEEKAEAIIAAFEPQLDAWREKTGDMPSNRVRRK